MQGAKVLASPRELETKLGNAQNKFLTKCLKIKNYFLLENIVGVDHSILIYFKYLYYLFIYILILMY